MRFDCGPTRHELCVARENWHRWWAWHPVRLGDTHECVWLGWVQRRGEITYATQPDWEHEYREDEDKPLGLCRTCGGDGLSTPCAYPGERRPGCLQHGMKT